MLRFVVLLTLLESWRVVLINPIVILMVLAKLATVCDVTNKMLSSDSNCIVDVVILPKPGNSNISMREVIIASNL